MMKRKEYIAKVQRVYDKIIERLEALPVGWRIAFGDKFASCLAKEIVKSGAEDEFEILQVKEKFGEMRFYTGGLSTKAKKIIRKYEKISRKTCVMCGAPAKWIYKFWITGYCSDCAGYKAGRNGMPVEDMFYKINDFYGGARI